MQALQPCWMRVIGRRDERGVGRVLPERDGTAKGLIGGIASK